MRSVSAPARPPWRIPSFGCALWGCCAPWLAGPWGHTMPCIIHWLVPWRTLVNGLSQAHFWKRWSARGCWRLAEVPISFIILYHFVNLISGAVYLFKTFFGFRAGLCWFWYCPGIPSRRFNPQDERISPISYALVLTRLSESPRCWARSLALASRMPTPMDGRSTVGAISHKALVTACAAALEQARSAGIYRICLAFLRTFSYLITIGSIGHGSADTFLDSFRLVRNHVVNHKPKDRPSLIYVPFYN